MTNLTHKSHGCLIYKYDGFSNEHTDQIAGEAIASSVCFIFETVSNAGLKIYIFVALVLAARQIVKLKNKKILTWYLVTDMYPEQAHEYELMNKLRYKTVSIVELSIYDSWEYAHHYFYIFCTFLFVRKWFYCNISLGFHLDCTRIDYFQSWSHLWQSSRPASFSPAGLTLWPSWLERWLATLSGLSVQVRIPVGLSGHYTSLGPLMCNGDNSLSEDVWVTFIHDANITAFMMTSSNGNIFRVFFYVFFHLRLNKRLSKQPRGWWFEMPPWSLWRHCNGYFDVETIIWCIMRNHKARRLFQNLIAKDLGKCVSLISHCYH